jgi:hypothetical protein
MTVNNSSSITRPLTDSPQWAVLLRTSVQLLTVGCYGPQVGMPTHLQSVRRLPFGGMRRRSRIRRMAISLRLGDGVDAAHRRLDAHRRDRHRPGCGGRDDGTLDETATRLRAGLERASLGSRRRAPGIEAALP